MIELEVTPYGMFVLRDGEGPAGWCARLSLSEASEVQAKLAKALPAAKEARIKELETELAGLKGEEPAPVYKEGDLCPKCKGVTLYYAKSLAAGACYKCRGD